VSLAIALSTWFTRAIDRSVDALEIVHKTGVALVGLLLCLSCFFGVRALFVEEPPMLMAAPFIAALLVFPMSLIWHAHGLYREEYDRRVLLEGGRLAAERRRDAQARLATLTEEERGALRQLLLAHQMHGDHVRHLLPDTCFVRINAVTPFLHRDAADYWTIIPDWLGLLTELLAPCHALPTPAPVARSHSRWSFWVRALRRLCRTIQDECGGRRKKPRGGGRRS
jgi:hypothetical protein